MLLYTLLRLPGVPDPLYCGPHAKGEDFMAAVISRLLAVYAAVLCIQANAQSPADYPTKPITVIVSTAAGSAGDSMVRSIAPRLIERLKQPIVVENKVGASGAIGAEYVAKAPPDGYTLFATVNTMAILPALRTDLPYDLLADFSHISKLVKVSLTFGMSTSIKANDLKELVALIKANPGNTPSAARERYAPPYGGRGAPAEPGAGHGARPAQGSRARGAELIGGHVDMMVSGTASIIPAAKTGKVKLLASTGNARSAFAPDIPTFKELGYDFMADVDGWYALSAPAKTPGRSWGA